MAGCRDMPRIVWKSNFFGTVGAFALLDGVVDVYVADFKFGNDQCAKRIAGVDDYLKTVTRNVVSVAQKGRLMVRHLLLPGHFDCCFRPIVDWMRHHLPKTPLRVLTGYLPRWRASCHHELASPLDSETAAKAIAFAAEKGLILVS
jgi:putative pyruvate formate lyase activating enzyme